MKKFISNRAQLFVRNKYTVLTIGGTVAPRNNMQNLMPESYRTSAYLWHQICGLSMAELTYYAISGCIQPYPPKKLKTPG